MYQSPYYYDGPLLCGFNVAIKGLRVWEGVFFSLVLLDNGLCATYKLQNVAEKPQEK